MKPVTTGRFASSKAMDTELDLEHSKTHGRESIDHIFVYCHDGGNLPSQDLPSHVLALSFAEYSAFMGNLLAKRKFSVRGHVDIP